MPSKIVHLPAARAAPSLTPLARRPASLLLQGTYAISKDLLHATTGTVHRYLPGLPLPHLLTGDEQPTATAAGAGTGERSGSEEEAQVCGLILGLGIVVRLFGDVV